MPYAVFPQQPVVIRYHNRLPYRQIVLVTACSRELGLVSQVVRYFTIGAIALMRVTVGSGLVLSRHVLQRAKAILFRQLINHLQPSV